MGIDVSKLPVSKATNAYDLLEEVCQAITEVPERYNQQNWVLIGKQIQDSGLYEPACGTVCCVAGWVVTMVEGPIPEGTEVLTTKGRAERILGLSGYYTDALFDGLALQWRWASKNRSLHRDFRPPMPAVQSPEYAALGVEHIRAFMERHQDKLKAKEVKRGQ